VIAVRVDSARQAVGLLHGAHRRGLLRAQSHEVLVSADTPVVRWASTGRRCACPPRCAAPSAPVPCGCGFPASDPACDRRGAGWTGRRCGSWSSADPRPPMASSAGISRPRRRIRPCHRPAGEPDPAPRAKRASTSLRSR
jgi:hypothetical protein